MDLRQVDLNLLVVFAAVAEARSVTRAAEALGLSQPATSASLARLRVLLGDPLFVRAGAEMRPTPRATQLVAPVRQVLATVSEQILPAAVFDPAATQRSFTLLTPDIGEINFLPKLLAHMAAHAPGVGLKTLSMPRHAAADALDSGAADLALGHYPDLHKGSVFRQRLFRNQHVCIVRRDHPAIGRTMSLRQFLAASHAVVRPDGRAHVFEEFLLSKGLARRVQVEVAHFMSLLPIVSSSDLVATVPRDLAEVCVRYGHVRMVATPMKAPAIELYQLWHRRVHKDAGHAWLRGVVWGLFSPMSSRRRPGSTPGTME